MPHLVLTVRRQGAEGEAASEHDHLVPEGTPGARVRRLDDARGPASADWPHWSVQDPEHDVMMSDVMMSCCPDVMVS